jgi:hypothetical protein
MLEAFAQPWLLQLREDHLVDNENMLPIVLRCHDIPNSDDFIRH